MNIYFVRHFKTQGNLEKRYIGRTDESLADITDKILPQTLPQTPDLIITSPMLRCLQTKALLYPAQAHIVQDDLREMDFGAFEMLTYADLKDNTHYRNFIDGTEDALQGEATSAFKARCVNAFTQLMAETRTTSIQNIVIVCHGGTIMSILEAYAAAPKRSYYDYQIANGAVLACSWNGQSLTILPETM